MELEIMPWSLSIFKLRRDTKLFDRLNGRYKIVYIRFNFYQIFYTGNHLIKVCIFNHYLLDLNTSKAFFSLTSTPNELSFVTETRLASDLEPYLEVNDVDDTRLLWKAIRVAGKVLLT